MGTRADFYVGVGKDAEWLGSIAWDGYPSGIDHHEYNTDLLKSTNEQDYRERVGAFFIKKGDEVSRPKDGWPWPWKDSRTTDFSYWFDGEQVLVSEFGRPPMPVNMWEQYNHINGYIYDAYDIELGCDKLGANFFPQFDNSNPDFGPASGIIMLGEK